MFEETQVEKINEVSVVGFAASPLERNSGQELYTGMTDSILSEIANLAVKSKCLFL
jgi:hypothetical protein